MRRDRIRRDRSQSRDRDDVAAAIRRSVDLFDRLTDETA
jgi:hypothetical protein